jgi:predicted metalloenzyme YecM
MKNLQVFLDNSVEIVGVFNKFVIENNLQDVIMVDHICYKCESNESFEEWRKLFDFEAKNFYQAIISKRRIATVIFKQTIKTEAGEIAYLELSDQKPDGTQTEGFDHIEFVPKNKTVEDVVLILGSKNIKVVKDVKPHITQYQIDMGKYNFRLAEIRLVDKIKTEEFK